MARKPLATTAALLVAWGAAALAGAQTLPRRPPQPPPQRSAPHSAPAPPAAPAPPPRRPNSLGPDWRLQQDEVRQGVQSRHLMPLAPVIERLRERTPGRELDAGLEQLNGRPTYRVRWMTRDGRRVDYLIDAASGQMAGR